MALNASDTSNLEQLALKGLNALAKRLYDGGGSWGGRLVCETISKPLLGSYSAPFETSFVRASFLRGKGAIAR